jgi:hypothetical protein
LNSIPVAVLVLLAELRRIFSSFLVVTLSALGEKVFRFEFIGEGMRKEWNENKNEILYF